MKVFFHFLIFSLISLFTVSAQAATFTPTTAAEFQTALDTAETNGEDDTIELAAGTFNVSDTAGPETFNFSSAENFSLTISGASLDTTILASGGASETVLSLTMTGSGNINLSELTIQDGDGVSAGGALLSADAGSITVDNVFFSNNNSVNGGGLNTDTTTGDITITNSTFEGNFADGEGGGLYLESVPGGTITIDNIEITDNEANTNYGGAAIICRNTCNISNSTVTANSITLGSVGSSAGINLRGIDAIITVDTLTFTDNISNSSAGGLRIDTTDSDLTLSNSTFENNQATTFAGALSALISGGSLTLTDNTISGNSSEGEAGGATITANNEPSITIENNIITENTAAGGSSGLSIGTDGDLVLVNNIISDNVATADDTGGVGISCDQTVTITNNTIANNTSGDQGGGLFIIPDANDAVINIYNNIIYGNTATNEGDDIFISPGVVTYTANLFNNNFTEFCVSTDCDVASLGDNAGNNLNVDPLFTDPTNGGYALQETSPMIDTGDDEAPELPTDDIVGTLRSEGGVTDIGAYEFDQADDTGSSSGGCNLAKNNSVNAFVILLLGICFITSLYTLKRVVVRKK